MNLAIARLIIGVIAFLMVALSLYPLHLVNFYLIVRPLVQPFAYSHYTFLAGIPIAGVLAVLLIAIGFCHAVFRKESALLIPNVIPLYVLTFFSSLSFINTMDYATSISHVLKILTGIAVYLLVYNSITSKEDGKKVLYAIVIAAIIPMLFGYYQYLTATGHAWKEREYMIGTRIDSVFGEFNAYGIFLCLGICATMMLFLQEQGKLRKWLFVGLMSSMVVSLFLSLNRGSWIAFSFALLVGFIFYRKKVKARWFIIAGISISIFFSATIIQRFQELNVRTPWGTTKDTFSGRIEHWKEIIPLSGKHPVVGYGIGTASLVTLKYFGNEQVPHNDYLRIAFEVGIPAALLYVFFLLRELAANIKRTFDERNWFVNFPMLVAITYFCVISLTQNIVYNVVNFPLLLTLMGVSRKWNMLDNYQIVVSKG